MSSEKPIASGPPSRSGSAPPPMNSPTTKLPSTSTTTPIRAATMKRVNFGRHADGAGLVDDEHAEEHAERAHDRLA